MHSPGCPARAGWGGYSDDPPFDEERDQAPERHRLLGPRCGLPWNRAFAALPTRTLHHGPEQRLSVVEGRRERGAINEATRTAPATAMVISVVKGGVMATPLMISRSHWISIGGRTMSGGLRERDDADRNPLAALRAPRAQMGVGVEGVDARHRRASDQAEDAPAAPRPVVQQGPSPGTTSGLRPFAPVRARHRQAAPSD